MFHEAKTTYMYHPTDRITHTTAGCYTSRGAPAEKRFTKPKTTYMYHPTDRITHTVVTPVVEHRLENVLRSRNKLHAPSHRQDKHIPLLHQSWSTGWKTFHEAETTYMYHPTDRITHTVVTPVVEHRLEKKLRTRTTYTGSPGQSDRDL